MPIRVSRRNLFRLKPTDWARLWRDSAHEKEGADDRPVRFIRPPGAFQNEEEFMTRCERCGLCSEACPHNAIAHLGPIAEKAEGTPFLTPDNKPCHWCVSMDCIHACPSGALSFGDDDKVRPVAIAVVDTQLCLVSHGILCDACVLYCPPHIRAITVRGRLPVIDADKCTGCGLCAHHCEGEPHAISIQPLELTEPQ